MEAVAPERRLAGRYVLEELIATGGMAEVWRARDDVLARMVAVKILRADLADDPSLSERFQREAVTAARLTHPHIVSVFDTGVDDDTRYIVMEHFAGRSLREILEDRKALPTGESVSIMLPVLEALGFAHGHGLIHRDVKPGNILVEDGRVKVTDFGIAKAAYAHGDLTTTGAMLGTVRYVSPEQVEGGEIDSRSDLYSAGVVLYEMLTGRPPFTAQTDVATAMMRLTSDPLPPRAIRPGIPRGLESVVMRALARGPEDRFSSAEAMRAALERQAGPFDPSVTQPFRPTHHADEEAPSRRGSALRSWMLVPLLLILLAGAAVAAGLALGRLEIGGPLGVRPAPQVTGNAPADAARIRVVGAKDYDPQGADGSENSNETPLAIDGNPSTAWVTDHYSTAAFGRLKDGVGLWLEFGRLTQVGRVMIRSPLPGWTFELKAGSLARLSGPLASDGGQTTFSTSASGRADVTLEPVKTSGILIWITGLAPDQGRFAAAVAEVSVQGPS
jgi:tRNA A-37 threonylcarbamoyl transferase component Bud32